MGQSITFQAEYNQGASVADYFNATGTGAAPHTIL